ncbi:hypothetical protein RB195_012450 [Necator americanus]|uniref:Uncharacterized protein n=1 Tax=Necator americanus TaxID=51031 RepID=A0ABR1D753_NECAM
MRCLVLCAICAWIACAEDDCSWDMSVGFSVKGFDAKDAPKGFVEAVEKFLAEELPKDSDVTTVDFKENGKTYVYVKVAKGKSNPGSMVFEKRDSELLEGKRVDQKAFMYQLALCQWRGMKPRKEEFSLRK